MKKGNLVTLFMGTIGGILLAIGMCMCLVTEWGAFVPGVFMGIIGVLVLLLIWPVYRKAENKAPIMLTKTVKQILTLSIFGGLALGLGLSMCLIPEWNMLVLGMILGVIGIVMLVAIIPVYKNNR